MSDQVRPDDIRRMEKGKWYWIEKQVTQEYIPKVGYLGMCTYHLLASMADENQCCFPSQHYIAERLGCSRASVSRAIHMLRDNGLIRITNQEKTHPVYCLLKPRCVTSATDLSHGCKRDVAPVDTNNTPLQKDNNNIVINSPVKPTNRGEILSKEIAEAVGEKDSRKFLQYASRYDETLIKEVLIQVKRTQIIKKSRTALFIYLLRHHAKKNS